MKNNGGNMSISILFGVSCLLLVLATFIYIKREDNDFKEYKENAKAMSFAVGTLNSSVNRLVVENQKLMSHIEAAHEQADSAKSKAEIAEALAHKVAVEVAKRPATQPNEPIKFEPIRVVIYDKRQLQKKANPAKPIELKATEPTKPKK